MTILVTLGRTNNKRAVEHTTAQRTLVRNALPKTVAL